MSEQPAKRTDRQRIDALQALTGKFSDRISCRWSTTGRGWRLHEDNHPEAVADIREAIDRFLDETERCKTK